MAGFYRTCVIDGLLEHSPAEHIHRPKIDAESATLGLDRMELPAFIVQSAAAGVMDHALACLLGLVRLRVGESCSINIEALSAECGHRTASPSWARAPSWLSFPSRPGSSGPATLPPATAPADRCCRPGPGNRMNCQRRHPHHPPPRQRRRRQEDISPHSRRHSFITAALDAGVPLRDMQIAARHADLRTTTRYDRSRNNLARHASYIVTAFVASAA